jgi:hypothetical protein
MTILNIKRKIALPEFAITFVPFAILVVLALMGAELTQNLVLSRTIYSIWVTMLFLIPAVCLYILPGDSDTKTNYWLLCWTFGFFAYVVHFYYTVGVIFHGDISAVYAEQGPVIATSNFLDTVWWGVDVVLGWWVNPAPKLVQLQRVGAHIFILATFFVSAVVIKTGTAHTLGLVMTASILICLALRIKAHFSPAQVVASPS